MCWKKNWTTCSKFVNRPHIFQLESFRIFILIMIKIFIWVLKNIYGRDLDLVIITHWGKLRYEGWALSIEHWAVSDNTWAMSSITWAVSGRMWAMMTYLVIMHDFRVHNLNLVILFIANFNCKILIFYMNNIEGGPLPWVL